MDHVTNDLLLAYVRRQQLYLWTPAMKEHLRQCPFCRSRCMEFEETGTLLEAWGRATAVDSSYRQISTRVMRTLYAPGEVAGAPSDGTSFVRKKSGFAKVRIVSISLLVVLVSVLLFAGLRLNSMSRVTNKPTKVTATTPPQQMKTPFPTATVAPIEATPTTAPISSTPIVISPSGPSEPTVTAQQDPSDITVEAPCTSVIDVIQNQLHVCGKNFTPGTFVTIDYYVKGSTIKEHSTQVGAQGTFNDMLYIQACDNVPDAIYVRDTSNLQETAQITHGIAFGTCQSFGGLKKNK